MPAPRVVRRNRHTTPPLENRPRARTRCSSPRARARLKPSRSLSSSRWMGQGVRGRGRSLVSSRWKGSGVRGRGRSLFSPRWTGQGVRRRGMSLVFSRWKGRGFRGRGSRRRGTPCSVGADDRGGPWLSDTLCLVGPGPMGRAPSAAPRATHPPVAFRRDASFTVRPWSACSPTASSSSCASGVRLKSLENIDALPSRGGARVDGRPNSVLRIFDFIVVFNVLRTLAFKHQQDFARRLSPDLCPHVFSQPSQATSPMARAASSSDRGK